MNFLETPRVLMPKERLFSTSKSTDAITNFGFFFHKFTTRTDEINLA